MLTFKKKLKLYLQHKDNAKIDRAFSVNSIVWYNSQAAMIAAAE